MVFWAAVGGVLVVLLVVGWSMDRAARRHGSSTTSSGDISYQAREGRRDAEVLGNPLNQDLSWSSWSRRNGRR